MPALHYELHRHSRIRLHGDRHGARLALDVAADHEDHAELADGVGEAEDHPCQDAVAGQR